jgi:carboxypeptidase family protein
LAQDARGVVAGSAVGRETDAPMPFALVRLRSTDSAAGHGAQVVTNAQGRYSFPSVPAGEYRLKLEYLDGNDAFSHVSLDYADIPTAGANLRLPRGGSFILHPLRATRGTTVTGSLSFGYGSFLEVLRR